MKISSAIKMNHLAVLIISISVSILGGDCNPLAPSQDFSGRYLEINDYLEKNKLDVSDIDAAMSRVSGWMSSLGGTQSQLMVALKQFVSLADLTETSTCNRVGYGILYNNFKALSNLVRYGLRPIDRIAKEFARRHAKLCASIYPRAYLEFRTKLDKSQLERVEAFADSISRFSLSRNDYPVSFRAKTLDQALSSSPMNFIYLMDDQARDLNSEACSLRKFLVDKTGIEINSHAEVTQIFREYIEQPCQYYLGQVGPDFYEPAEFDARIRLDERLNNLDDGPMEYRLGMAYHKICQMYISSERKSKIVNGMLDCRD